MNTLDRPHAFGMAVLWAYLMLVQALAAGAAFVAAYTISALTERRR